MSLSHFTRSHQSPIQARGSKDARGAGRATRSTNTKKRSRFFQYNLLNNLLIKTDVKAIQILKGVGKLSVARRSETHMYTLENIPVIFLRWLAKNGPDKQFVFRIPTDTSGSKCNCQCLQTVL